MSERISSDRRPMPAVLGQGPLRAIVNLAAPTTAVMLLAAISNVLHTYFVSRLGSEAIAAVSLVFPISLIMVTVMSGGFGTGVASGVARALGAGCVADARAVAEHALLMTVVSAVIFTAALEFGSDALFRTMGGEGEVLRQATLFARTLFAGLAITFFVGTFDSIMRGEGNVRMPSICAGASLGLQIALTPLFMFAAGLGLIGAPLAMLTGQFIGALPRARYIFAGSGAVRPRVFPRAVAWRHFAEILRVGVPASLAAVLNYIALMVLTGTFARFDSAHLAAYGLGTRLDFLLFSLGYGAAVASLTLVGMATGAGRSNLVRQYVARTVGVVVTIVAVPVALIAWRPALWLGMFTGDTAIHRVGTLYFRTIGPTYVFSVSAMVLGSSFQGLGKPAVPLAVTIVRVAVVVGFAIIFTRFWGFGPTSVFLLVAAGNIFSCLSMAVLFYGAVRRLDGDQRDRPSHALSPALP